MRDLKDWERCTVEVGGRFSLSGVHTWTLDKKRKRVTCNFCGALPPTIHRARMYEEWLRMDAEDRDQRRRQSKLRKLMRGG